MADGSPIVGRRKLAVALRAHRLATGRTIDDVAHHLECSSAKISRIETGTVKVGVQDLRAILDLYRIDGSEREGLLTLVRQSRSRGWWAEFADVVPSGSSTFYGLEDGATSIRQHTSSLVPGLLQTEAYARALIESVPGAPIDVLERRVQLRMRRQEILARADRPQLDVIVDEAVLHRTVGGSEVLATQLEHMLETTSSSATLRVVEFSAGAHPAAGVSFSLFSFANHPGPTDINADGAADRADAPVVFRELLDANHYLDDPPSVATYAKAWSAARSAALSPEESADLLRDRIAELRS